MTADEIRTATMMAMYALEPTDDEAEQDERAEDARYALHSRTMVIRERADVA